MTEARLKTGFWFVYILIYENNIKSNGGVWMDLCAKIFGQKLWASEPHSSIWVRPRLFTYVTKTSKTPKTRDVSYTFISTSGYERFAAARVEISSRSEPKRAENLRLRFASSAHLLQQTEQKAKIMAERWRH